MLRKILRVKLNRVIPQLLPKSSHILIAVSGGQDSLCLAQLLIFAQIKWQWQLAIAHCDHRWRLDSRDNALHVQKLATDWGVPFYLRTAKIQIESEAKAREWRYQMLAEMAREANCQVVVTGHTASDRAETLLYNLVRGSGTDGLQSLGWQRPLSSDMQLVRPLLNISRQETADFCQELKLAIWEDSTNHSLCYKRNRIREELIPYLCQYFNPAVEKALSQTAELLSADVEYLEAQAHKFWQEREPKINRVELQQQAKAIQRRAIHQFLSYFLLRSPDFSHVERLILLLSAPNRSHSSPLAGGWQAEVEHPFIYLRQVN
ncbi:tRNA(Ile)-lysidine synthetase [Synechococcus sp. PCC 7502]|uniref:tRNA lysidine(34) synthetase TilS n=1 Tax=Synechococcus sp. PCC 7502 TaxID=1173263 RepID=UPI00029F8B87|nr:tRNA lysidine(34) synthetase TilS [Synechococcus sp. PCC 7502]AFY74982.1 tRNA(Ile)-lysidine synthetase [Synechococcus sp. PCC 7502]